MTEAQDKKPYSLLHGNDSMALPLEEWDQLANEKLISYITTGERDDEKIWKDQAGQIFRVTYRQESGASTIGDNSPRQGFANIVALTPEESKKYTSKE